MRIPVVSQNIDLVEFTKQLSVLLHSGVPITEALATLNIQAESHHLSDVIEQVNSEIQSGSSLHEAMGNHTDVFNEFYISMVQVGEESGQLVENLSQLSDTLKRQRLLRENVKSAMLYPVIVLSAITILGGSIAYFILPQLVTFFEGLNVSLPITTKILLWVSQVFQQYYVIIFGAVGLALITIPLLLSRQSIKPYWHSFLLMLPVVGVLVRNFELAKFSRNLGTLLKSGVSIHKALDIMIQTTSNHRFKEVIDGLHSALNEGRNMGTYLDENELSHKSFPPLVTQLITVGEKSGSLDENLLYLAEYYDEVLKQQTENLSKVLEPVLLIFVGLIVGFIALSIISPIYQITGSLGY